MAEGLTARSRCNCSPNSLFRGWCSSQSVLTTVMAAPPHQGVGDNLLFLVSLCLLWRTLLRPQTFPLFSLLACRVLFYIIRWRFFMGKLVPPNRQMLFRGKIAVEIRTHVMTVISGVNCPRDLICHRCLRTEIKLWRTDNKKRNKETNKQTKKTRQPTFTDRTPVSPDDLTMREVADISQNN